jgi:hypothetical protein
MKHIQLLILLIIGCCRLSSALAQTSCPDCSNITEIVTKPDREIGKHRDSLRVCFANHSQKAIFEEIISFKYGNGNANLFKPHLEKLTKEIEGYNSKAPKMIDSLAKRLVKPISNKLFNEVKFSVVCTLLQLGEEKKMPVQVSVQDTSKSESNSDSNKVPPSTSNGLYYFVGMLVIGALGVLFYLWTNKTKNGFPPIQQNTGNVTSLPVLGNIGDQIDKLNQRVTALESEKYTLISENSKLKSEISQKDAIIAANAEQAVAASHISTNNSGTLRIYAPLPMGKAFYRTSDTMLEQETYFVIEFQKGSNTGRITLVEDATTKAHAFSLIDGLRSVCELRGTGRPNIHGNVSIEAGRVEKTPDAWVLVSPIILTW